MSARLVVLASLASAALAMPIMENLHDRAYYEEKFFNWLSEHKIEATSGEHFVKMIQNFANNDDLITQTNNQNLSYTLGHNKFSHLSVEEYREYVKLGLNKPENVAADSEHVITGETASSVNWVDAGAVTGVKDQGQCGSCWSFSSTGAMEGALKVKTGTLPNLSEQNFVDCDNRSNGGSDLGCNGGLMDSAFSWAQKNGGICSEKDYPYTSGTTKKSGTCNQTSCKNAAYAPKGYTDVKKNSDADMMNALNLNPVAIAIEADQSAFQLYKSGVFTGTCGASLDHGVLAVGYGTENGQDYYLVKNSWGTSWGDKGYIKLGRGSSYNGGKGQCGMLSGPPSFPKY